MCQNNAGKACHLHPASFPYSPVVNRHVGQRPVTREAASARQNDLQL